MNVRAIFALSDRLDADTREQARRYMTAALRGVTDQAEARPDRLFMVAQMMRNAINSWIPNDHLLRGKIGGVIDQALAKGDAGSAGLAIGMAAVAACRRTRRSGTGRLSTT